ncbi:MAG: apolipoprotein A1/A4/E family protein [Mycoplasmataceae bacterium]|jgi:hypothetical protein|nr:apolipoprotein A1/A4/E family protein [Mycoplasmataceae bacterium]
MIKVKGCKITDCEDIPELNGLIIKGMEIESIVKVKNSGGKVKQPTLLELKDLILGVKAELSAKIDDVEGRLSARIDDVETRLNKRMDGIDARLDIIETRLDGIDSRLDRNNLIK